jgi:hypothetical protein
MSDRPEFNAEFVDLWNELPDADRMRLAPYLMEVQIRNILQCRQNAVDAHKLHLKRLDEHVENIKRSIIRYKRDNAVRALDDGEKS